MALPCPRPVFISSPLRPEQCVSHVFPLWSPNIFPFLLWLGLPLGDTCQHASETCVFTVNTAIEKDRCRFLGTVVQNKILLLQGLTHATCPGSAFLRQRPGWVPGFGPLLNNFSLVLEMPLDLSEMSLPSLRSLSYIDKTVTRHSGRCRVPFR